MLLTIAGIFLLSNLILNVHKANTDRMLATYSNESVIDASGLAQSVIDEIQSKSFDENTILAAVWDSDSLTSVSNLGPDAGEYYHTEFDDIDDYNNFNTTVTLDRMGDFDITVYIHYVKIYDPSIKSAYPTYNKIIELYITNFSLLAPLEYSHIVSY
jgi:hypothetical protein